MRIKEFFSFQKNGFFWINILAMIIVVCLLIFGILYGLDKYTRHGKSITVPELKGMSVNDAKQTLKNAGLKGEVIDSTYVKNFISGGVLEQNPANGMRVKAGRMVYLTVNTQNVPLVTVPDVADNSSFRQAHAKLLASGFKLTTEEYVPGDKDWVYGVKYMGRELTINEKVPMGATLTLLVGQGIADWRETIEDSSSISPDNVGTEPNLDDSWF